MRRRVAQWLRFILALFFIGIAVKDSFAPAEPVMVAWSLFFALVNLISAFVLEIL